MPFQSFQYRFIRNGLAYYSYVILGDGADFVSYCLVTSDEHKERVWTTGFMLYVQAAYQEQSISNCWPFSLVYQLRSVLQSSSSPVSTRAVVSSAMTAGVNSFTTISLPCVLISACCSVDFEATSGMGGRSSGSAT